MKAIQTKYLPATNFRGSRIKATCERGSLTIPYPYGVAGSQAVYDTAARALCDSFAAEDESPKGRHPQGSSPWRKPFVSGQLKDGTYVHVFTS